MGRLFLLLWSDGGWSVDGRVDGRVDGPVDGDVYMIIPKTGIELRAIDAL